MSDDTTEHPDDRAMRLESEQYGRDHAAEFRSDHARDMQLLVETYADDEAASILEKLRGLFWANEWKPRDPKKVPQRLWVARWPNGTTTVSDGDPREAHDASPHVTYGVATVEWLPARKETP